MKVLLVVSGFPTKENPSRSAFNLMAARLLKRNHEVIILKIRAWKPGRKFIVKENFMGFQFLTLSFPLLIFKFYESLSINHFFIKNLIKKNKNNIPIVDIVHSVGGGLTSYTSYRIYKELNYPYIIQYIGDDVNFYLKEYNTRLEVKNYINDSSFHIFNSKALLNEFNIMFKGENKLKTIYRGIDLKDYKINIPSLKTIKIVYFGGLVSGINGKYINNVKGGVDLLKAWKILDSKLNLTNVKLYFGGPNSISASKYIKKAELNFPESFRVIGEIQKIEVKKHLFESHIIIIPSLFEGVPNVVYEAMASGNVVIGTKVGGIPEIIEGCGILIEPENAIGIAVAIEKVVLNKKELKDIIIASRKRVENFDNAKFLKGYSQIYDEVKKDYQ